MERTQRPLSAAHQEFRDNIDRLSRRAMGMFLSASYLSPASVIAQGARIAEYCKEENLDPSFLRSLLSGNEQLLEQIALRANSLHKANNNAPKVTQDGVAHFVRLDFSTASDLMILEKGELSELYGSIWDKSKRVNTEKREDGLQSRMDHMLKKAYARRDISVVD